MRRRARKSNDQDVIFVLLVMILFNSDEVQAEIKRMGDRYRELLRHAAGAGDPAAPNVIRSVPIPPAVVTGRHERVNNQGYLCPATGTECRADICEHGCRAD